MKNNEYWVKRANQRMKSYHQDTDKTIALITKAYEKAQKDIQQQIDNIFETFARKGELTPEKAKKILNERIPNPLLNIAKRIYRQTKNEKLKKWLLKRINAPAYRARITRLEALKESVYLRIKELADVEISLSESSYLRTISEAYYRTMFDIQRGTGYGFEFARMSSKQIEEILLNPWSGHHFSERVWGNTDVLAEKVTKTITAGFMSGVSSFAMAKELDNIFQVGMFAASRLVRTETTFMANMAEMASYEEAEIDRYQFIATLDMRTSPQCREMDMKVFKVSEAVPGKNMPPLHPFCRSTTVAYFGEEELENLKRRARDPVTGKTYLVPANMNYEQWYNNIKKKYGPEHIEVLEKKIRNKSADKKQFKRYREILGDRIPKSFDDFQDLKYNRKQEWEKLQDNFYVKSRLKDGRFGSTINPEKQAPHMESTRVEGKSYFFDGVDVQALFDKYAGTGVVERTNSGKRSNKEIVLLDKNENIGIVVSLKGVKRANAIKIHHSKKRTHIVPHFEEE